LSPNKNSDFILPSGGLLAVPRIFSQRCSAPTGSSFGRLVRPVSIGSQALVLPIHPDAFPLPIDDPSPPPPPDITVFNHPFYSRFSPSETPTLLSSCCVEFCFLFFFSDLFQFSSVPCWAVGPLLPSLGNLPSCFLFPQFFHDDAIGRVTPFPHKHLFSLSVPYAYPATSSIFES